MDDLLGGCLGGLLILALVVGVIGAVIAGTSMGLAFAGLTFIVALEFLAHGLAAVGLTNPIAAWLVLGVLVGGSAGFALGLGKAGKKAARPLAYGAGATLLAILLLLSPHAPRYVSQERSRVQSLVFPDRGSRAWWQGFVGNSPASLETYIAENGSMTGFIAVQGVQEGLNIELRDDGAVILQGINYRRFGGQGSYNLDRFEGAFQRSDRLQGSYRDTAGRGGQWWFQKDAVIPWDGPIAAANASEEPASLAGEWIGTISAPSNALGFKSEFQIGCTTVGERCGTVRYLELRCMANLVYRGWQDGAHRFDEVAEANKGCSNGSFTLAPSGAGIRFQWMTGNRADRGSGTLRRVSSPGSPATTVTQAPPSTPPPGSPPGFASATRWQGRVSDKPATLDLMAQSSSGEWTGTMNYDGVIEELSATMQEGGALVLAGRSYRRVNGSGSFALDTFSGQLSADGRSIDGSYQDASGHRGQWNVTQIVPESAAPQPIARSVDCDSLALRLYNVDDYFQANLANSSGDAQKILSASERQDTGFVDIGSHTARGVNTLTLQLTNYQKGYAYGYQLRSGSAIIDQASCGQVGIVGCNNNEFRPGVVFTHEFRFECPSVQGKGEPPADPNVSPSGDPVYRVGNGVSAPSIIEKQEPVYTEQAREAKLTGTVQLSAEIDVSGRPRNIKVVRGLGLGLDENAVESVRRWRFRPALKDGRAVTVAVDISVDFRLL